MYTTVICNVWFYEKYSLINLIKKDDIWICCECTAQLYDSKFVKIVLKEFAVQDELKFWKQIVDDLKYNNYSYKEEDILMKILISLY